MKKLLLVVMLLTVCVCVYSNESDEVFFDSLGFDIFENWKAEIERTIAEAGNNFSQTYWNAMSWVVRLTDYGILKGWVDRETRKVFPHLMGE